jgi:hypothetical protein
MILKWDKVGQLCLDSFSSGDLAYFSLEQRKWNLNRKIYEQNGKNQTRTERYINRTARGKFSISPTAVAVTLLALAFLGDETAIRISI